GGYRVAVSRAAPTRAAAMDRRDVEGLGEQAAHEGVPPDRGRPAAAGIGALALGDARRRDGGRARKTREKRSMSPFGRRRDQDLRDEIASHLRMAIEDRIARGMPADEAVVDARRELGNLSQIQEAT